MNRTSFPTRTLTTLTAACATAAALVAPAAASAADRWVDTDTGANSGNTCTVQANPCKTIQKASDSSQIAGEFGTIHVDQGTYGENINVAQGNHVTANDFVSGDSGQTTITGTGSGAAVFVQASAPASALPRLPPQPSRGSRLGPPAVPASAPTTPRAPDDPWGSGSYVVRGAGFSNRPRGWLGLTQLRGLVGAAGRARWRRRAWPPPSPAAA